jgi:hypothetical protein
MTNENGIKVYKMLLGGGRNGQPVIFAQNGDEKHASETYDPAVDAYQIFLFLMGEVPSATTNVVKELLLNRGSVKEIQEIQARLAKRENPELYAAIEERKAKIDARKAAKQSKKSGAGPSSAKEVA